MFQWHVTYKKFGRIYQGTVEAWDHDSATLITERKYGKQSLPMVCSTGIVSTRNSASYSRNPRTEIIPIREV